MERYLLIAVKKRMFIWNFDRIIFSEDKCRSIVTVLFQDMPKILNSSDLSNNISMALEKYALKFLMLRIPVWGMLNWLSVCLYEGNKTDIISKPDHLLIGNEDAVSLKAFPKLMPEHKKNLHGIVC